MGSKTKKKMLMFLFVVVQILTNSCTQSSTQLIKVNHFHNGIMTQTTDAIMIKQEGQEKTFYTYYDSIKSDSSIIMEVVYSKDRNYIEYNKTKCTNISDNQYFIDGNACNVGKYLLDKENVQDEELLIFFNEKYGVIIEYSEPWSTYRTYKTDSLSAILVDNVLKKELNPLEKKLPEPTGKQ